VSTYGRLLRRPGALPLLTGALVTWTAGTMTPVAFVLFAREVTGSYARAGLVLAALSLGTATAPLRGRLVDLRGARAAVLVLAVPGVLTDVALIVAGRAGAPLGALLALALVAGAVVAPVGTAVRSAWTARLADDRDRQAGYALLAAFGEVSFFAGPLLAGALAGFGSPTLAVAVTAGLTLAGALLFASAAPGRAPGAGQRERGRLGGPLRLVLGATVLFGLCFGALDVALPAAAQARGSTAAAGVLLSALAAGLGVTSLVYGARGPGGAATPRFPALTALAAAGLLPLLALPGSLVALTALAALAGAAFAPVTVTQSAAIGELAPEAVAGEAFAWLGTCFAAGSAGGAALAGVLVSGPGIRAAVALACAAVALAAVLALPLRSAAAARSATAS
jgi:MFS family permease